MALTKVPNELSSTPSIVDGGNSTAITINSSEQVGINTGSPTAILDVRRGDASGKIAEFHTSTGFGIELGSSQTEAYIQAGSNQALLFNTNDSNTRMRLSSAGDLLVAKTTSSVSTDGVELTSTGFTRATVNGDTVLQLNRRTSDGTIINFRKDGTTVGSVGTANSGDLYIGNDDTSLLFAGGSDAIIPRGTAGATRDAAIDLGLSGHRFKDLYLSGGVNFSANANASGMTSEVLDDYEEGSWTPALSSGTMGNVGVSRYTKVGRLVTCYTQMDTFSDVSSGTAFEISGLPFTADLGNRATTLGILASRISNIGAITGGYLNTASPPKLLLYNTSASSFRNLVHSDFSANNSMYISFTYFSN